MQHLFTNWVVVLGLLVIVLSGCASASGPGLPTPTIQQREAIVALPAMLAEPQRWSGQQVILVAPVQAGEAGQVLTAQLTSNSSATPASELRTSAIWLSQPLPEAITRQSGTDLAVVRLRGTLSPPGAYGRDEQFSYQFSVERADLLQPERTTIANLATNPGALDRISLLLEGTLLVQRDAALLIDRVSARGLPATDSRSVKLSRRAIDEHLLAQLTRSGEVRWGSVQLVGWWQDGTLIPFAITPVAMPEPSSP